MGVIAETYPTDTPVEKRWSVKLPSLPSVRRPLAKVLLALALWWMNPNKIATLLIYVAGRLDLPTIENYAEPSLFRDRYHR